MNMLKEMALCAEASVDFTGLHGVTSQKKSLFVVDLIIIDLTVNIVEIVLGISQLVLTVCLRPIKCHLLCSARCQIYKESVRKTSLSFTMKMATLIFTETSGNIYSSERHNH